MHFNLFRTSLLIVFPLLLFSCQSDGNQGNEDQSEQQTLEEGITDMQQQPPADADISQEELQQFATLTEEIQIANQELQQKMVQELENQGIDLQRFNELQQAEQNPQAKVDATDQELANYQTANKALAEMQLQAQQEVQKRIEAHGLSQERLQEINMALQNSPELQASFQQIQEQQAD